jgi:hypothetical protein
MLRILFLDRSNPVFVRSIRALAREVADLPVKLVFLSDKEGSEMVGNLQIVNIHDVTQRIDIKTLELQYGFSIHRALVPERSFFDYSSFRRCQRYSDLTLEQIERLIAPYVNALDALIRDQVDLVIDGFADNFMTSVAGRIARHYGKPFYMNFAYYWWEDGLLFADRMDQTSSEVDRRYAEYRANPARIDRARVESVFAEKRFRPAAAGYDLRMRLQQLLARRTSYEPLSLKNWISRRVSAAASRLAIRSFVASIERPLDEQFVLFPLHVLPEATLLGSAPEIADQFGLIKNISMNLPFSVRLYVKEHPAQQLGAGLDYGFYRRLSALPNVRYVRASANLPELLQHRGCLAVAVINGTVGLEAAFMFRKPVFVFAPALYQAGGCFLKPGSFEEFGRQILEIRSGRYVFDEEGLYAVLQAIDDCVVRASVDFTKSRNWTEMALQGAPIYREFLVRQLKARRAGSADCPTEALH